MGNPDPDECDLLTSALRKADESWRRRVGLLPAGEPAPGLWRHYKGGLYCVLATCTVAEPNEHSVERPYFSGRFSEEPRLSFRGEWRTDRGIVLVPEQMARHWAASRVVVYVCLSSPNSRSGSLWARPLAMFMGFAEDVPRFEKVGS